MGLGVVVAGNDFCCLFGNVSIPVNHCGVHLIVHAKVGYGNLI